MVFSKLPQISSLAWEAHLRMACKIVVFSLVSLSLLIGLIAAFSLPIAWCRVALRHHTDKNPEGSSCLNEVPTQRYTSCRFVSPGSEIALGEEGQSFDVLEWPKLVWTTVHRNFVPCEPPMKPQPSLVLPESATNSQFELWFSFPNQYGPTMPGMMSCLGIATHAVHFVWV